MEYPSLPKFDLGVQDRDFADAHGEHGHGRFAANHDDRTAMQGDACNGLSLRQQMDKVKKIEE